LSKAELHDEHITCFRFSEILETRFRFIETDRYHYQRLLEVKQRKDEDALSLSVKAPCTENCPVREILQYKMRTNLTERRGRRLRLYMARP
jgi:hypothetical protein